jgi:hypothetical protein
MRRKHRIIQMYSILLIEKSSIFDEHTESHVDKSERKVKINKKKHSRACMVAAAIRNIVSEFGCHPVYIDKT